ncbi:hypothetical protein BC941DRAFT_476040 [Chlamydoabsidia padenii]|nr:hypothetical protein BC941DRAFT_476040 [Chlamydoabsidia padenii]
MGDRPWVTEVFVASNSSDPDAYTLETDMIDEPILATRYSKTTTKMKNWKDLHGISTIESTMGSP